MKVTKRRKNQESIIWDIFNKKTSLLVVIGVHEHITNTLKYVAALSMIFLKSPILAGAGTLF